MKFLIKWTKEGDMRYISHLDIMRVFQRALKREGIKLKYSEGYSPHPKMSIAQPLSLGYTSIGEYIVIETHEDFGTQEVVDRLNSVMPVGVKLISCSILEETKKSMGAIITKGEYLIGIFDLDSEEKVRLIAEAVEKFKNQKEIFVKKLQKKSGKVTEIEIKKMISSLEVEEMRSDYILIRTMVDMGSTSYLSPEQIIKVLKEYTGSIIDEAVLHVQREEMFTNNEKGELIPLYALK